MTERTRRERKKKQCRRRRRFFSTLVETLTSWTHTHIKRTKENILWNESFVKRIHCKTASSPHITSDWKIKLNNACDRAYISSWITSHRMWTVWNTALLKVLGKFIFPCWALRRRRWEMNWNLERKIIFDSLALSHWKIGFSVCADSWTRITSGMTTNQFKNRIEAGFFNLLIMQTYIQDSWIISQAKLRKKNAQISLHLGIDVNQPNDSIWK